MNCFSAPILVGYLASPGLVSETCRASLSDTTLSGVVGITAGSYFYLFGLTLLLETPLYFLCLRKRVTPVDIVVGSTFMNLCTHPLVILGFPQFVGIMDGPKWLGLLIGEIFAPVIEGLFLRAFLKIPLMKSFVVSFAINFVSWSVGIFF